MTHPWTKSRPISAWIPAGFSEERSLGSSDVVPKVNTEQCSMCGICWLLCPEGIISRENDIRFRYAFCRGCGICAAECPKHAIDMFEEGVSSND